MLLPYAPLPSGGHGSLHEYIVMLPPGYSPPSAGSSLSFYNGMLRDGLDVRPVYLFGAIATGGVFEMSASTARAVQRAYRPLMLARDATVTLDQSSQAPTQNGWNYSLGGGPTGANVTVAVIDTGVDYLLPALGGKFGAKVVGGYNLVDDNANPMDTNGHGTEVASIIAADSANFTGVAPGARILAYKVFHNGQTTLAMLVKAMDMAVGAGAKIINLSLGGGISDPELSDMGYLLSQQGVELVAAAGNEGPAQGTIAAPASMAGYFAVGASTSRLTEGDQASLAVNGTGWVSAALAAAGSPFSNGTVVGRTVYVGSAAPGDVAGLNLTGEVAVAMRDGKTYFGQMEADAATAGASALIVVNNANGPLRAYLTLPGDPSYAPRIPVLTVPMSNGAPLMSNGTAVSLSVFAGSSPYPATFSSRGPANDFSVKPEVLAPADPTPALGPDGFALVSGTSFAVPQVAGALALLAQEHPGLSPEQCYSILALTADPISSLGAVYPFSSQGAGVLDIPKALAAPFAVDGKPYVMLYPYSGGRYAYSVALTFLRNVSLTVGYTGPYGLSLSRTAVGPSRPNLTVYAAPSASVGAYDDQLTFSSGGANYTLPVRVLSSVVGLSFNPSDYTVGVVGARWQSASGNLSFPDGESYQVVLDRGSTLKLRDFGRVIDGYYDVSLLVATANGTFPARVQFYATNSTGEAGQLQDAFPPYVVPQLLYFSAFLLCVTGLLFLARRGRGGAPSGAPPSGKGLSAL